MKIMKRDAKEIRVLQTIAGGGFEWHKGSKVRVKTTIVQPMPTVPLINPDGKPFKKEIDETFQLN